MGYTLPPTDALDALIRRLIEAERRIAELERPTGTQTAGALKKLQDLVAGLLTQVNGVFSGYIQAGGNANIGGDINLTGYLFTAAGYGYDITYTRRAAWLGSDGRLGWASSSIDGKVLLNTLRQPDALKILDLMPHYYQRKLELAKADANSDHFISTDYHVATEWGGLAEEFHAAGLWQVVIYEWDVEYELVDVLDDDGQPILNDDGFHLKQRVGQGKRLGEPRPVGLHYELMGLLAIWAARHVYDEHLALERRVAVIEQAQGL